MHRLTNAVLGIAIVTLGLVIVAWEVIQLYRPEPAPIIDQSLSQDTSEPKSIQTAGSYASTEIGVSLSFPPSWGQVAGIRSLAGNGGPNIETYRIRFTDNTEAIYQTGLDVLYFMTPTAEGNCFELANSGQFSAPTFSAENFSYEATCRGYEGGFYHMTEKRLVESPSTNDVNLIDFPAPLPDLVMEIGFAAYTSETTQFSPRGKYMVGGTYGWEGCYSNLLDTSTGEPAARVNCDPIIFFSEDEKTVAIISDYGGMASPSDQFDVVKDGVVHDILSIMEPQGVGDYYTDEQNYLPSEAINIQAVDNEGVTFRLEKAIGEYGFGYYRYNLSDRDKISTTSPAL